MKKILFLLMTVLLVTGCSEQVKEQQPVETSSIVSQQEDGALQLVLQFPEELAECVIREKSTYGLAVTETFYLKNGEDAIPLFRIDVGDQSLGDWLGTLQTENGNIPVTYTVFEISEDDMAALGENAEVLYADLMNGFNLMLEQIFNDPSFTSEKAIEVGESQGMAMRYWTVDLPDDMWVEENMVEGNYEAVFYCSILGEHVAIYKVCIGEVTAETELGLFDVEGVKKTVSVGSFDIPENPNWSSEDYSMAYRLMETINLVIETIMQSEHFSMEAE